MMDDIIWLIIMAPVSALFTGIGIYAWRRKKPMWFWSGSTVEESEISDVAAYNRANGIMWLVFSLIMWVSVSALRDTGLFLWVTDCRRNLNTPVRSRMSVRRLVLQTTI